jgi:hypothetical protein
LNSTDSNIVYNNGLNDGRCNWDLSRANISCKDNEMLALSLVRAELPSTTGIMSTDCGVGAPLTPSDCNLVMNLKWYRSAVLQLDSNFVFNSRHASAFGGNLFPLTLQTTINDMIYYINNVAGEDIIMTDDVTNTLGLFRLKAAVATDTITFEYATTSDEIKRALGIKTDSNTTISNTITTPFNYDMSSVLPSIRLKANYNFNSESSNSSGDSNILDSIGTALSQGNQYMETVAISLGAGVTLNVKNKSALLHDNSYMTKLVVPTKRIDEMNIQLVSKDNKALTVCQQPFLLVIQVDVLDSL